MNFHEHDIHFMEQTSCFHFPVAAGPMLDSTIPHSYLCSFPLFSLEAGNKPLINISVAAPEGTRALLWKLVPIPVPIPVTSPGEEEEEQGCSWDL